MKTLSIILAAITLVTVQAQAQNFYNPYQPQSTNFVQNQMDRFNADFDRIENRMYQQEQLRNQERMIRAQQGNTRIFGR